MPKDIAVLPVGPGSKSRDASAPAKGADLGPLDTAVRGRPGRQTSSGEDRSKAARAKLDAVAANMAAGKFTDRGQSVEPAGDDTRPSDAGSAATPAAAAPSTAPTAEPAKSKPAAKEPTAEEKAERTKRLATAKRALALDGWKPERISKLDEDELLEIGEHRAKNQADVNREFAKLRNASSPTGARAADGTFAPAPPAAAKDAKDDAKKDDAAPSAITGDKEIDAMIDAAQDEIGEPAVKLLKAITNKLTAKMAGGGDVSSAVTTEMLYSTGREIVERDYATQLEKDPSSFDEVAENFKALVASGRYGRGQISKVWRDAAFMTYGAPNVTEKAQRDMLARQAAADVGRVDPGTGDSGSSTEAPITNQRDALKLAGQMMAANPTADPEKLRQQVMARIRGNR